MKSLTFEIAGKPRRLELARLTPQAVAQLVDDLSDSDEPLVLGIEGLSRWPEENQQGLWLLWKTVSPERSVKLRVKETLHVRPIDFVLTQLKTTADPEECERRLRAAALAVALCYSPDSQAHAITKIVKHMKSAGGVSRRKVEQLVAQFKPASPKPPSHGPNPTLLAADFLERFRQKATREPLCVDTRVLHYHHGAFYAWDQAWRAIVPDEMRALVVKDLQDCSGVDKVTNGLTQNVLLNLQGLCLVGRGDEPLPFYIEDYGPPTRIRRRQLLVLQNGLLSLDELAEGEKARLLDFDTRWFSTSVLPFDYDPKARCPQFKQFLYQVLERDPQDARALNQGDRRLSVLQEWFGYTLLCDGCFQKFLLMVGEGSNGKGVIQNLWIKMLGGDNVSHVSLDQLSGTFALQPLLGKLANICGDLCEIDAVAEGILKRLTGQDNLTVNRKNQPMVTMAPAVKLIFGTNALPRFNDKSRGIWRRLVAMPFRVVIPDDEQDETLTATLEAELPGILNWALRGLKRLLIQGHFSHCIVCAEAAKKHQVDCNPVAQFVDECVRLQPPDTTEVYRMLKDELYRRYGAWCKEFNYKPLSKNKFNRQIAKLPRVAEQRARAHDAQGKRPYYWIGLGKPLPVPAPSEDEEEEEEDTD